MRTRKNATRRASQVAVSASHAVESAQEWEVYGTPEVAVGRALSSSRRQRMLKIRPVGALRQTTEGIELLFFPSSASPQA